MADHAVCPWWVGYMLASPLRRLLQDPSTLLAPYVRSGMTVLEPGPAMGFFTLELARLVGPSGRVIAVDVQPQMIRGLQRRAHRAGLAGRIDARVVSASSMALGDVAEKVDFAFAFAVVHEMPPSAPFFAEAARALKPNGTLLLGEPAGHVDETEFAGEIAATAASGFIVRARPFLRRYRTVLLARDPMSTPGV